ncbi:hypothetical protein [Sphingobium baderi]|uniref:UmuC domain-containing protein n=1 Tax=Sphingobium baderi TaxID=1332080 RepID=A0A0S3EZU2_9SPHN|nr:hypothetical protein [Sphingobium baderi]ALR20969.1 hypothetical protein ATN00_12320 [Sphingobium baderi]
MGDAAGLEGLAIWALRRYSPIVAADPPGGLRLDMAGTAHLLGGEAAFMADLDGRLADSGISARIAIAPTYGAAHSLARFDPTIVQSQDLDTRLAPLPIMALWLDGGTIDGLRRLGVDTVGELAAMPRALLTTMRSAPFPSTGTRSRRVLSWRVSLRTCCGTPSRASATADRLPGVPWMPWGF